MPEIQRHSAARRLFLLIAGLGVVAVTVMVLGEPESLGAEADGDGQLTGSTLPSSPVLARVAGEAVTEDEIRAHAAGELIELERERHELLERTVEARIRARLADIEAKKRGLATEELLRQEIDARSGSIPAVEVEAFYQARRLRQPLAQVEEQIRRHLASEAFYGRLSKGQHIERLFEPFRVEVGSNGPSRGPADAPVTLVEMSDFECPFCGRMVPVLEQVRAEYGEQVRVVYRHFPLDIHPQAIPAAAAALCADEQGFFWEMHDRLFADQGNLGAEGLRQKAGAIEGVDLAEFESCLSSQRHVRAIEADREEARRLGVRSTPAIFINGRLLSGTVPYESLVEVIEDELARQGANEE